MWYRRINLAKSNMVAEAVKVIVRCRPMNSREKDLKSKVRQHSIFIYLKTLTHNLNFFFQPCVFMEQKMSQCSTVNLKDPAAQPKTFTFDGTYYTDSTTEQIYNEIAYPLVEVCTLNNWLHNGQEGETYYWVDFELVGFPWSWHLQSPAAWTKEMSGLEVSFFVMSARKIFIEMSKYCFLVKG